MAASSPKRRFERSSTDAVRKNLNGASGNTTASIAGGYGVWGVSGLLDVTNYGTLTGRSGTGIQVSGNLTLNNSGTISGSFIGDYTGVAVNSIGKAHAAWTDFRGLPGRTTPNQDTVVGNEP